MFKKNSPTLLEQKGFIQIFTILLLLAGIVGGVYLVQQTQIFKPKAASNDVSDINRDGRINIIDHIMSRVNNSTSSYKQKVCANDVKECSDGSFVSRDPNNNCSFKQCPQQESTPFPTPSLRKPNNNSFSPQIIPKGAPMNFNQQ